MELLRVKSSKNKTQFAEIMGLKSSHYSEILSGERKINTSHLSFLNEILGVNVNWLLTGSGEMFDSQENKPDKLSDNSGEYSISSVTTSRKDTTTPMEQTIEKTEEILLKLSEYKPGETAKMLALLSGLSRTNKAFYNFLTAHGDPYNTPVTKTVQDGLESLKKLTLNDFNRLMRGEDAKTN